MTFQSCRFRRFRSTLKKYRRGIHSLISSLVDFCCPARPTLHYFSLVFHTGCTVVDAEEMNSDTVPSTTWDRILFIGADGAISTCFNESSLTTYLGEELVYLSDFGCSGRFSLSVFSISGCTEMASNTAVAVLSDANDEDADTGDLRVLPCPRAACGNTTKGNCVCTNKFPDFLKTGLVTYIIAVFLGIHIIYGMGICVFELVKSIPTSPEWDTVSLSSTFSTLTEDVACHVGRNPPRW